MSLNASPLSRDHSWPWLQAGIVLPLLGVTLLQRIGLTLSDTYALQSTLIGTYVLLFMALMKGVLEISAGRAVLILAGGGIATLSLLVSVSSLQGQARASAPSLYLLLMMYAPLAFRLRDDPLNPARLDWLLAAAANLVYVVAWFGIAQFALQFVIRAPWLFDFTPWIPEVLRGPSGFNTVIPVGSMMKSNGFFVREPSGASFLMAFGVILEMSRQRRKLRLAVMVSALLLTYSGTGLLALAIGLMFPFGVKTMVRYLVAACLGGLIIWLLGDALNLNFTVGRVQEFQSEESSGYIRYVAPMRLILETWDAQPLTMLIGSGPGSILRTPASYAFHDPTWAKAIFEYGLPGFACFVGLFVLMMKESDLSSSVKACLFAYWLLMGGHLLTPESIHWSWLLLAFIPKRPATVALDARSVMTRPAFA